MLPAVFLPYLKFQRPGFHASDQDDRADA